GEDRRGRRPHARGSAPSPGGLLIDVRVAVVLVLSTSLTDLRWTKEYWIALGLPMAKSVLQAIVTYVARKVVPPKRRSGQRAGRLGSITRTAPPLCSPWQSHAVHGSASRTATRSCGGPDSGDHFAPEPGWVAWCVGVLGVPATACRIRVRGG